MSSAWNKKNILGTDITSRLLYPHRIMISQSFGILLSGCFDKAMNMSGYFYGARIFGGFVEKSKVSNVSCFTQCCKQEVKLLC